MAKSLQQQAGLSRSRFHRAIKAAKKGNCESAQSLYINAERAYGVLYGRAVERDPGIRTPKTAAILERGHDGAIAARVAIRRACRVVRRKGR